MVSWSRRGHAATSGGSLPSCSSQLRKRLALRFWLEQAVKAPAAVHADGTVRVRTV